jgi:hypothetical protein
MANLAAARYTHGENRSAEVALAYALSSHCIGNLPHLAMSVAASANALGVCSVDSRGVLTVQLTRALRGRSRLAARLDGTAGSAERRG